MRTRDGVDLLTESYVPDDAIRRPVLLARTPYGRAALRSLHDPLSLVEQGWAVVLQDVRGRFGSQGAFQIFHQETADGADTIAWCAAQPWSSGRVAMTGSSYSGLLQWLAAVGRPPALGALGVLEAAGDIRDGWIYEQGLFKQDFLSFWALIFAVTGGDDAVASKAWELAEQWDALVRSSDLESRVSEVFPDFARWAQRQDETYWAPIDLTSRYHLLDVAAWHLTGWYDMGCEGSLDTYVGMVQSAGSERARRSQRLVIGPWTHAELFERRCGDIDFGPLADGRSRGLPQEMSAFLLDAVRGDDVEPGASVFVMGSNAWRDMATWPPPSIARKLHLNADRGANGLSGDGQLQWEPAASNGCDRFQHDPSNPVPSLGGRTFALALPRAGPRDQRPAQRRDDVLVYSSEPLNRDVTIIGQVRAVLTLCSTASEVDVAVRLCDVSPDGVAINVVDSAARVPLTPSVPHETHVDVGSTAMTFKRGHRIRVDVASSNSPRFAPLRPAATQSLLRGGGHASFVSLPTVE